MKEIRFLFKKDSVLLVGATFLSCCTLLAGCALARRSTAALEQSADGSPTPKPLTPLNGETSIAPCPLETGWNGSACVEKICPRGLRFRTGSGCVHPDGMPCFGGCGPESEVGAQEHDQAPDAGSFPYSAASDAFAKIDISSCSQDAGPRGVGHMTVTFTPTGEVQRVRVDRQPFAGTPVGACVALKFRSVRVPAFEGPSVEVSGAFSLR